MLVVNHLMVPWPLTYHLALAGQKNEVPREGQRGMLLFCPSVSEGVGRTESPWRAAALHPWKVEHAEMQRAAEVQAGR